ncbi:MAG: hypothetical protein L3J41_14850 [Melioribacteraceae bacterium]|nr:hypothetical protein [Melioribacteraceae bacterium]
MPLNLIKKYNQLLDLDYLSEKERITSLINIFNRDIRDNSSFKFRTKQVNPISTETDAMELLFKHLTTTIVDIKTRKREFETNRSKRLHWVKFHIDETDISKILVFSVEDPNGIRTYIYDEAEKYVIILEPYRDENEYYLLTAYYLTGRNKDKIKRKYKRRLPNIV